MSQNRVDEVIAAWRAKQKKAILPVVGAFIVIAVALIYFVLGGAHAR